MEILIELYTRLLILIGYLSVAYIATKIFLASKIGKKLNKKLWGGK